MKTQKRFDLKDILNSSLVFFKKYPLSPFLFPLFLCLHTINFSFVWGTYLDVWRYFLLNYILVIVFFLISIVSYRSQVKAGVFALFLLLFYFYFGYLIDLIGIISQEFTRARYVLTLLIVLPIAVFYFLYKADIKRISKLSFYTNIVLSLFLLIELLTFGYQKIYSKPRQLTYCEQNAFDVPKQSIAPDIYFVVFDEYASSASLKENFGYTNSIDSFLIASNFKIITNSKSNYAATPFSIASTLNMSYFENIQSTKFPDDFNLACIAMYKNRLFSFLSKQGYTIHNYSIIDYDDAPSEFENFSRDLSLRSVINKTITEIGFVKNFFNAMIYGDTYQYDRWNKIIKQVDINIASKKPQPEFTYIHFLLPHSPYYFDENGNIRPMNDYTLQADQFSVKSYLNQVTFTNSVIKKVVSSIQKSQKNTIILLEGDHGFRCFQPKDLKVKDNYFLKENNYKNLNAFYFYDKNYSKLYDSISPVNSFRVILNQYFNVKVPLVKDSCCFNNMDFIE